MTEQDLAVLFTDSAKTIRQYREELAALAPEVEEESYAPLDQLVEYLERQFRAPGDRKATSAG